MQNETKNTTIQAIYYASVAVDFNIDSICEELNIKKEDIKNVNIKWATMYLTMKDGTEIEYDINTILETQINEKYKLDDDCIDFKRPMTVLDEYGEDAQTLYFPFKNVNAER